MSGGFEWYNNDREGSNRAMTIFLLCMIALCALGVILPQWFNDKNENINPEKVIVDSAKRNLDSVYIHN